MPIAFEMSHSNTIVLAAALALAAGGSIRDAPGAAPGSRIESLTPEDLQSLPYECDCELYRGEINGRTTVFATRRHGDVALMRIDGAQVVLRRTGASPLRDCAAGGRLIERWANGGLRVTLTVQHDGKGDEACWYKGRLTIADAHGSETIAVAGACGC